MDELPADSSETRSLLEQSGAGDRRALWGRPLWG